MGRHRHLYLIFFLSGASGLVYESMWSRYLRLFVGSASTAQVLVLALFMGGMSVGALSAGRWSKKVARPIVAYGLVEAAIGLYALAFPHIHDVATRFCYDVAFPAMGGGMGVSLTKWGMAAAMVLPPCILLGTTFPLMSVGILRRDPENSGSILSHLYFSNSLGASMGALLTGFALVPAFGLPGALACAAALNAAIMIVALLERREDPPLGEGSAAGEGEGPSDTKVLARIMVAVAFGTGLSSFMYEIGWIRLLSMILGSATHSFEVMLSAFVFGLALGGFWVRKRMDRWRHPELVLGAVQLIMGMSAVFTLPLYRLAVLGLSAVFYQDERTLPMWLTFNVVRYLLCLLIMLPATFCAGMTLPLCTHVLLRRGAPEAVVGRIYGMNTLGAIVGATSAGLLLLPLVGLKWVVIGGAAVDMLLGLWLIGRRARQADPPKGIGRLLQTASIGTASILLFGGLVIKLEPQVLAASVFRRGKTRIHEDFRALMHVDGRTATVTVMNDVSREGYHTLYTNGKPDASVRTVRWPEGRDELEGPTIAGDEPTQILVGAIPLLMRPQAKRAAVIGIGSGVTSHVVLASETLERVDTVEIEPMMARGARYFSPINDRTFEDPRSHLIFDDAKAYFASAAAHYDIVVSEPSNPWVSGVSSLFTVEFYREVKRYIRPGGLLAQWIHGYELGDELLLGVLSAIDSEFDDFRIYRVGDRDWLIVSSPEGPVGDLHEEPMNWPKVAPELKLLGIHSIGQIDALFVADKKMLHPDLAAREPNRDARPLLDNGAERARFFRHSAEALLSVRFTPLPLASMISGFERRPYPLQGFDDVREDRHVLHEPELAAKLLRSHARSLESPDAGTGSLRSYFTQMRALDEDSTDPKRWMAWLQSVYAMYNEISPWFDLRGEPWWAEVKKRAADRRAPDTVKRGVELLDAVIEQDADRMWAAAQTELAQGVDGVFDHRLVTLVGALALDKKGVPASERQAFVREHMDGRAETGDSDDRAYRILRAYFSRQE